MTSIDCTWQRVERIDVFSVAARRIFSGSTRDNTSYLITEGPMGAGNTAQQLAGAGLAARLRTMEVPLAHA